MAQVVKENIPTLTDLTKTAIKVARSRKYVVSSLSEGKTEDEKIKILNSILRDCGVSEETGAKRRPFIPKPEMKSSEPPIDHEGL